MSLGNGIYCRNLGFGSPEIAITASGYYYTAIHAWSVTCNEVVRYLNNSEPDKQKNNYTVEMAHATPAIVNMAFACELAFKSIIPEANRKNVHKLRDLFDLLEPQYQKAIIGRTIADTDTVDEATFYSQLDEYSNNFVEWRYFYEKSNERISASYLFLKAMIKEIFEMYGIGY